MTAQRKMRKQLFYMVHPLSCGPSCFHSNRPSGKLDKKEPDQRLQKELMEALRKKSELADKVLELSETVRKKDGELNQAHSK